MWRGIGLLAALAAAGCAAEGVEDADCEGAKCDLPGGPSEGYCPVRQRDALHDNTVNFTPSALRWECRDVDGVTPSDYGQEYCEFFALVELPDSDPVALGRRLDGRSRTDSRLELSDDQLFALEDDGTGVYGHCVFTSWFSDSSIELDGQLGSVAVSPNIFRTKLSLNSRSAAVDLVEQCAVPDKHGDVASGFERGCVEAAELFDTGWRRSDPTICASSLAMADCHCTGEPTVIDAILPYVPGPDAPAWQHAGLPLGSWQGRTQLPPGCEPVATAGGDNIVVACELTGDDLIDNQSDLVSACNTKYASSMVVHLPIPESALSCDAECGDTPWVIED